MIEDTDFLEQRISSIFVDSLSSLLRDMLDINIEKSVMERRYGISLGLGYDVAIGIVGNVKANVLYEFDIEFANAATEILNSKKVNDYENKYEFYAILRGVISEIANIVSGNAIGLMSKEKIDCDITPPFIYYGHGIQILPRNQEVMQTKLSSKLGKIVLSIAVEENKKINVQT